MRLTKISILLLVLSISTINISYAQSVGINDDGSSPNAKAMLDVKSNSKGLLIPRMSTADRIAMAPVLSEQGIMVYDTTESAFYYHTGTEWKEISETLWEKDAEGINRTSNVGINTNATSKDNLYVYRAPGLTGADTSTIYGYRAGAPEEASSGGGTGFGVFEVDAAIKGLSDWGNPFSAGVAGYGYLDYPNSAALIGSIQDGSTYGILGFMDAGGTLYSGYFEGDARFSDNVGIGINPNSAFSLNVQSSTTDRAGYFYNTKSSASSTYGLYAGAFGNGTGNKRGGAFDAVGGTGENIAVRGYASGGNSNIAVYGIAQGGTTNWAAHFDSGDVIIDDQVGIGTQTIAGGVGLHVMEQSIRMEGPNDFFDIVSTSTTNLNGIRFLNGETFQGALFYDSDNDLLNITGFSSIPVLVTDFANLSVGIGTDEIATGYKLSVDGKIMSEELRIQNSTNWPDYVFADDYQLMPLDELEAAIATLNHLPNIPAADVVEEEGILVGDMQKRMMEKIEELTLYVIEINKQNQQLNVEVQNLKKELIKINED